MPAVEMPLPRRGRSAGGLRVDMQLTIVDAHHQAAFSLRKRRVRCRVCRLPVGPATDGSLELMRRGVRSNVALSQKPRPGSISRSVLVSLHTTILYVLPGFIQWEDGSTAATTTHSLSSVTVSEAIAWVRTTVPFAKPNLGIVHTLLQWEAEASVHVPGYLPSLSLHQYMDTTPERLAQLLNPSLGSDLACGLCTFINVKSATKCEMCDSTSRG